MTQYFPSIEVKIKLTCLTSLHGLVRGENMELGRDSDTGGQVILVSLSQLMENHF